MVGGNLQILEIQLGLRRSTDPELPYRPHDFESGHVRADQTGCRPLSLLATPLQIRLCERRDHAGTVRVPDPDLPAVERPLRAILAQTRSRLDVLRVRSDLGLGQRIRGEILTPRERR